VVRYALFFAACLCMGAIVGVIAGGLGVAPIVFLTVMVLLFAFAIFGPS
jgi:hypothetical protein